MISTAIIMILMALILLQQQDVSWLDLDSGGDFVQDEIEMSAYNVT